MKALHSRWKKCTSLVLRRMTLGVFLKNKGPVNLYSTADIPPCLPHMISFSFTSVSVIGESGGTKQYTEFIAKSIQLYVKKLQNGYKSRPVVPGCARCAMAHPDFGRSVNPTSTRGDRLCQPNYYWHTRIFRPSDGPEIVTQRHYFRRKTLL